METKNTKTWILTWEGQCQMDGETLEEAIKNLTDRNFAEFAMKNLTQIKGHRDINEK
jgi:hypothetical protein